MARPLRIESPGTSGRVTHRGRCRRGAGTPSRRPGPRRTRRPRFLNRDPIEEQGGLNLYAFCGNDGVNGYDVLGMDGDTFDKLRRGDPVGGNGNSGGGTGNSDSESPSGKDRSPPGESKSDKSEPIFHLPPLIVRANRGDDGSFIVEDRIQRYQNDLTMGQKRDDPNSAANRDITNPADVRNETKTYDRLNDAEKAFVKRHPLAALDFKKAAEEALAEAQRRFPDPKSLWNGPGDAFRHAYWNALMVKAQGPELAKQFADAHENFPGNDPREKAMDLFNNSVGRGIGIISDRFPGVPLPDLIDRALRQGQLQTGLKP
jgi:hypothetical protein